MISLGGGRQGLQGYMFPRVVRWLCLLAGAVVAYAQLVSVAFLFMYRVQDASASGQGDLTDHGVLAKLLVPMVLFEGGTLETFDDAIWPTILAGTALAVLGSLGLFAASVAKHTSLRRQVLMLLALYVGFAIAVVVFMIQTGATGYLNLRGTGQTTAYFLHGKLEFFGATAFPAVAYATLALWLVVVILAARARTSSRPLGAMLLPQPIRRACVLTAIFVAYAQFTSIGFLAFYRYHEAWDSGRYYRPDGYLNESFLVRSIWHRGGEVGSMEPHFAVFTFLAAILLVVPGASGLLIAACARRGWRMLAPTMFGSLSVGLAVAVVVLAVQFLFAAARSFDMSIDDPYEYFAMHGVLEAIGSTVVPTIAYLTLLSWFSLWWILSRLSSRRR